MGRVLPGHCASSFFPPYNNLLCRNCGAHVCSIDYVERAEQSPGGARLIWLTVLSSPAAIFVIVRSYNGLFLSASLMRGVLTLLKPITPGSPRSGCEAASQPPSRAVFTAAVYPLDHSCSMRDSRTVEVDELILEINM